MLIQHRQTYNLATCGGADGNAAIDIADVDEMDRSWRHGEVGTMRAGLRMLHREGFII
jgi:hypothetical protein